METIIIIRKQIIMINLLFLLICIHITSSTPYDFHHIVNKYEYSLLGYSAITKQIHENLIIVFERSFNHRGITLTVHDSIERLINVYNYCVDYNSGKEGRESQFYEKIMNSDFESNLKNKDLENNKQEDSNNNEENNNNKNKKNEENVKKTESDYDVIEKVITKTMEQEVKNSENVICNNSSKDNEFTLSKNIKKKKKQKKKKNEIENMKVSIYLKYFMHNFDADYLAFLTKYDNGLMISCGSIYALFYCYSVIESLFIQRFKHLNISDYKSEIIKILENEIKNEDNEDMEKIVINLLQQLFKKKK